MSSSKGLYPASTGVVLSRVRQTSSADFSLSGQLFPLLHYFEGSMVCSLCA